MTSRVAACGLLLALFGCSSGSSDDDVVFILPPRWANQQRVPTASHLRAVRFNNATQGIVAGESSSIFRTDDGGLTWRQAEHAPFDRGGDIRGLDFLGTEIQAVGAAAENALGRIWTSVDALNWSTPDAAGAGAPFAAVDVTASPAGGPPNLTWALRENWIVRISAEDGSVLVESTTIPAPGGGEKATSIDMLFSGPGYVVGEGGIIFETDNRAGSWTSRTGAGTNYLFDVQVVEAGIVFACGEDGTLVFTEEGGDLAQIPGGPSGLIFRGLQFIHAFRDTSVGWVVGDNGTIYRVSGTYDAMTSLWTWTWALVAVATSEDLYDVSFGSTTVGYAVGDNGMVVKLTDASGATAAQVLTSGSLETINAVSFAPNGIVGVAVGDAGKVYKTLNGGSFWSETDLGAQTWTGVSIPPGNPNVAFLCGLGGEIRRNLDLAGSNVWEATGDPDAAGKNFRAILFPSSADVGFAVGDGSTLLYTNSGSLVAWTWTDPTVVPAVTTDYKALASNVASGGGELYAAGSDGVIVTQTLSGYALPWAPATTAGSFGGGTIQALQAPVPALLFAAVDFGGTRLQRRLNSSPGPFVWEGASQPSPQPPTAAGLAFAGQSLGWWVGDGIYTTENAANPLLPDWELSPTHTKATFRGIWMNQAGTVGYVVGTNGTILKTASGGK